MGIIAASIPVFFLLIGAELLFARLGHRPFYRLNDSISDLSAGTLSQVAGIFTKVLLVGAYGWTFDTLRLQQWLPLGAWPDGAWFTRTDVGTACHPGAIAGWVVAFLAVDLAYYWFHRVSHEVNLFWAGHVVHHSSEEYNLAVALRQTAVGGLLSWIFYVPLAVLGLSLAQFATCYAINLVYQFWIHTRAIGRLPWRAAYDGGPVTIPSVSRATATVYDPTVPRPRSVYALAHFALAIPLALRPLREAAALPPLYALAGVFLVALTLTNVGGVLEARRWAFAAEQARLGSLVTAGAGAAVLGAWPGWLSGLAVVIGVASLAALWTMRRHFTVESDEGMDHDHAGSHGQPPP